MHVSWRHNLEHVAVIQYSYWTFFQSVKRSTSSWIVSVRKHNHGRLEEALLAVLSKNLKRHGSYAKGKSVLRGVYSDNLGLVGGGSACAAIDKPCS